jgi:hypothetical protein
MILSFPVDILDLADGGINYFERVLSKKLANVLQNIFDRF